MAGTRRAEEEYDYLFKVVLIGDSGVGKSNLLSRFTRNEFCLESKSTIGVEFATRTLHVNISSSLLLPRSDAEFPSEQINLLLPPRSDTRSANFHRASRSDLSHQECPSSATTPTPTSESCFVGNKTDLKHLRAVAADDARSFAEAEACPTSRPQLSRPQNVEEAFQLILGDIYRSVSRKAVASDEQAGAGAGRSVREGKTINVAAGGDADSGKKQCCSA
ncbi:hypothetical protein GUJ93_ZPchr0010g11256 [Zizania palustris]|uniref:Uncharacterized protein n=1 Tax=Zizania palustris TaxID=103762 RepID=A0A8J5W833_ZIZPA|nr:hypothetical protein GUJ93_ZPchr0010g11256 [Zizania palustris]